MSDEHLWQAWIESKRHVPVPAGFGDQVMARVMERETELKSAVVGTVLAFWLRSRVFRVLVVALAATTCLVRVSCLVSTFVVS